MLMDVGDSGEVRTTFLSCPGFATSCGDASPSLLESGADASGCGVRSSNEARVRSQADAVVSSRSSSKKRRGFMAGSWKKLKSC